MKTVLYHANCHDGFCCAYYINKYGEERLGETDFAFIPVSYGSPNIPDVNGEEVLIVDFSYPRDILLKMKEQAKSLLVIDHHKTAQKELEDLDFCIFNMNKCGAQLVYDYLFRLLDTEEEPIAYPTLIQYIADRDLWKWEQPFSKEVNEYIRSFPFDFKVWHMHLDGMPQDKMVLHGQSILRAANQQIDRAMSNGMKCQFEDYVVTVVNSPLYQSEIGHILCDENPFGVVWYASEHGFMYSLRSTGDFDVSEIAKRFNGGGHKNAAGFTSSFCRHFPLGGVSDG